MDKQRVLITVKTYPIIPKLPYKFSYKFEDAAGQESRLRVLDWEAGALYWPPRIGAGSEAVRESRRPKHFRG
jgi:hypothetical protein